MNPDIERDLLAALKFHAKKAHQNNLSALEPYPRGILITYGDLCAAAGKPVLPRACGPYLTSIALREQEQIDALVVTRRTGRPGAGWKGDRDRWPATARLAFHHLIAKK